MTNYPTPDSYGPALAAKREAEATPESRFAEQFKADRLRALAIEHAEINATPEPPRLRAAFDNDEDYTAPETYAAADLSALRARDAKTKKEAQR